MNFSSSSHSASDKYHTMKIYDIISEAPETTSPGGIIIPGGAKTAEPLPSTDVVSKVKGAAKSIKGKAATITANPLSKKIDSIVSSTPIFKKQAETLLQKIGSSYLWFLKAFNIYEIAVGLRARWLVIDDLADKGELTSTDISAAKRVEAEKAIVELTAAGTIARLIKWTLRIITLGKIGSAVGGILATVFTGGVLSAAAFAEFFLIEAASLAFQQWLETPEGQEGVAWVVINCMDPTAVWLYNLGFGRMNGEIKGLSKSGEAAYTKNVTPGDTSKEKADTGSENELGATSDAGYMDKIKQLIGKAGGSVSGAISGAGSNTFNPTDSDYFLKNRV